MAELESERAPRGDGVEQVEAPLRQVAEPIQTEDANKIVLTARTASSLIDINGTSNYLTRLKGEGVSDFRQSQGFARTENTGNDPKGEKRTAQYMPRDGKEPPEKAKDEATNQKAIEIPKGFKPVDAKDRIPGAESYEDEKTGLRVDVKNTSPEFRNRILTEIGNLPEQDRQRLKDYKGKIAIVGTNSDYFGENTNKTPRGWPAGSTWNNASGAYDRENKVVVIAEQKIDINSGNIIANPNPLGILKHEFGHGIDQSLGRFHNSEEFINAYNKDVSKLTPEQRKDFHYQLQKALDGKNQAGREETFADLFSALRGHAVLRKNPGGNSRDELLKAFPETAKVLESRLKRK